MPGRYVIIGASSGIGAAMAQHLNDRGCDLITVSRRQAAVGHWVEADITTDTGLDAVKAATGDEPLDGLLFLGGTWERGAFTGGYDFFQSPREETRNVIAVNLVAPILCAQMLAPNLAKADNPRIILIGSTSALDRSATIEVANTASKYGLRGASQALATALRDHAIGVSVINPGDVATDEVLGDIEDAIQDGAPADRVPIPLRDLAHTIDYLLTVSADAVPDEINLLQKHPGV